MALIVFPLQAVAPDPDIEYTARDFRVFVDTLITEGVADVAGGDLLVSQRGAGANLTVDVAVGAAFVDGDDSAAQGSYHVESDAVVNVGPFGAAPGSGARIDLVVLRVYDEQAGAPAGMSGPVIVAGVAAGSPVAPALPDSAIPLAEVRLNAGDTSIQTANITDRRDDATSALHDPAESTAPSVLDRISATTTVVNSTTETTMYSKVIPAGTLGAVGRLRLTIAGDVLQNSGATRTLTVRGKLGATTLFTRVATLIASASRYTWGQNVLIHAESAAAQRVQDDLRFGLGTAGVLLDNSSTYGSIFNGYSTGAENTALDRTLAVTAQMQVADASYDVRLHAALLELL